MTRKVVDAKFDDQGCITFIGEDGSKLISPVAALFALAEKARSLQGGPRIEAIKNAPEWASITARMIETAKVLTSQTTQGETVLLNLSPGQSSETSYFLLPDFASALGHELVSVAATCKNQTPKIQ